MNTPVALIRLHLNPVIVRASLALLLLMLQTLAFGSVVRSDGPTTAAERQLGIERSLACPQCTALPLDVCDRDICIDMRAAIEGKIAAGESDAAIRQYFVDRYGARVLLAPEKQRGDLVAWFVPFLALLVGAVAVFVLTRRLIRASRAPSPHDLARPNLERYRSKIEREIEPYE